MCFSALGKGDNIYKHVEVNLDASVKKLNWINQ